MYDLINEAIRRRPAKRWDRRTERDQVRRDELDGAGGDPDAPSLPRPVLQPSREVIQELALEMDWTEYRAEREAQRAANMETRLAVAYAMLKGGLTDDDHVKILDEYTWDLTDGNAARIDARVSPRMEHMTTGELRAVLRRELIKIDPEAAERRRKRGERHAQVSAYANPDGTGTLAIEQSPAAQIAAAKARLNALARAAKTAGSTGSVALLEAKAALGLLLGTFPYIPPPAADGDSGADGDGDPGPRPGSPDGEPPGDGMPDEPGPYPEADERPAESPVDGGGPGWMAWPAIPSAADAAAPGCAVVPAWLRPAGPGRIRLLSPWRTVTGRSREPGELSWFGPVTPAQVRELAAAAAADAHSRWHVIVTDDAGRAIAVETVRRRRGRHGNPRAPGLIEEVTLTIPASHAIAAARNPDLRQETERLLSRIGPGGDHRPLADVLTAAVAVANRAAAEAARRARLDAEAGSCAHAMEVRGYRVTGTLRRWITVRDRTCRNPVCRRRSAQCDQDHTVAYDKGGRTCPCDLGSLCRTHHQLKQLPGWQLSQDGGAFVWTTPAGLTYRKEQHRYPV